MSVRERLGDLLDATAGMEGAVAATSFATATNLSLGDLRAIYKRLPTTLRERTIEELEKAIRDMAEPQFHGERVDPEMLGNALTLLREDDGS